MPTQQRAAVLASTFAAGTVVAGTLFAGLPMAAPDSLGLMKNVHRDIALVNAEEVASAGAAASTDPFAPGLEWLFDTVLKIGNVDLPTLIDPHDTTTLASLLPDGWTMTTDMSTVFTALGLDGIKVDSLLPTSDLDSLLGTAGNTTLNSLMGGLGLGSGTTIAELVDKTAFANMTVDQLTSAVGMPGATETMGHLMTSLGLGPATSLLGLIGITSGTTLDAFFAEALGLSDPSKLTLGDMLNAVPTSGAIAGDGWLNSSIGDLTLGKLMGFTSGTTLLNVIDELKFPDTSGVSTSLGSFTLPELLGHLNITSATTLGGLLGELPLGASGNTTAGLGGDDLAQLLTALAGNHTVDATTTLQTFLTDLGMGSLTIDGLLGIS